MSTTAEKLTYLNETKSKIKDNINLTGAGLTNQTPFRQYATDLKTALLNILNNGIDSLYNNFPKTTGTGTNITLNNTLQAPIRSVINGDTQQEGTPTPDNPKEIKSVTGLQKVKINSQNLFDKDNASILNAYIDSGSTAIYTNDNNKILYIPIIGGNTYTVNKIKTDRFTIATTSVIPANNVSTIELLQDNNATSLTLNTSSDAKYLVVHYYRSSDTLTPEQILDSIQIKQVQEYEINLGKNLLKFPYVESSLTRDGITYTINNDGSISISGTATATSYINLYSNLSTNLLEKGNTYTYSISPENSNIRLTVLERYNNTWNDNGFGTNKITFTISNNSEGQLIRLIVTNGSTIDTTISPQIEEGSEATPYSPYFTPIHLYENDQIIGTPNNWSIKHVMGEVVLDGSDDENWQKDGVRYRTYIAGSNPNKTRGNCFSNYFHYISSYNTDGGCFVYEERAYFILEQTTATVGEFKTWLSTHNTKVVYPLAEPTTEPITNTELIEQLNDLYNAKSYNGQTNIYVEGDLQMILDVSAIIDE